MNSLDIYKSSSPQTLRAYKTDLAQAFELKELKSWNFCNNQTTIKQSHLAQISDNEAQDLLKICRNAQSRWENLSPASRNRKSACLKSFLKWLYEEGFIEKNLSHRLILTKRQKKLPRFLSVDEIVALLKSSHKDQNLHLLLLLLYGAGLRVSEACELKWSSVSFEQRALKILGKGQKERLVIAPKHVFQSLRKQEKSGDYIFGELPLCTSKAYQMVRKAGIKAQLIRPIHPHALRHSFATHLLTSGANLRTLQELLGHSSLQATEKYLHLDIHELARTLEDLHPLTQKSKD